MRTHTALKLSALLVGVAAVLVGALSYFQAPTRCSDFSSHAAAQRWFAIHESPWMDRDADGRPCERLR